MPELESLELESLEDHAEAGVVLGSNNRFRNMFLVWDRETVIQLRTNYRLVARPIGCPLTHNKAPDQNLPAALLPEQAYLALSKGWVRVSREESGDSPSGDCALQQCLFDSAGRDAVVVLAHASTRPCSATEQQTTEAGAPGQPQAPAGPQAPARRAGTTIAVHEKGAKRRLPADDVRRLARQRGGFASDTGVPAAAAAATDCASQHVRGQSAAAARVSAAAAPGGETGGGGGSAFASAFASAAASAAAPTGHCHAAGTTRAAGKGGTAGGGVSFTVPAGSSAGDSMMTDSAPAANTAVKDTPPPAPAANTAAAPAARAAVGPAAAVETRVSDDVTPAPCGLPPAPAPPERCSCSSSCSCTEPAAGRSRPAFSTVQDAAAAAAFCCRCVVFADLWRKGFFVTGASKFGADYLVYRGDDACTGDDECTSMF